VKRLTGVAAIAALALAGWWSIRLARADAAFRQRTRAGIDRAAALLPRAEYLAAKAAQLDYDGGDPAPLLAQAAAASPRWSAPRIQLGLDAESRGNFASAEKWLLEAAGVDHQFEPAWTLANFYFRRGEAEKFWPWIRAALGVSYGDRRLAFDLCWQVTGDPGEILKRAIPDDHGVIASYLGYLLWVRPTPEAVMPVAARLAALPGAARPEPADAELYSAACDFLIGARRIRDAEKVWAASGQPRPRGITHPDFEAPRTGHGFDWRWPEVAGVSRIPEEGSLRIAFNGKEPETSELLRQTAPLPPGTYLLRWESRTQGLAAATGLEWIAGPANAAVSASTEWSQNQAKLTVQSDWLDLVLQYRRPAGEARADGWLELRHVRITPP